MLCLRATPGKDILRRDIFDRPPVFKWTKGNVILLGDSAHAMQPNLGQGGCMAIEDAYQLAKDLTKATQSFRQPYYKLEETLVVSAAFFCSCCSVVVLLQAKYVIHTRWSLGNLHYRHDFFTVILMLLP